MVGLGILLSVVSICVTLLVWQYRSHTFRASESLAERKDILEKTDARLAIISEQLKATQVAIKKMAIIVIDISRKQGVSIPVDFAEPGSK